MRTITIDHMNVPSCGKFEIEWALRQIMGNPGIAHQYLANSIYEHFKGEAQDDCIKWADAARRAYDQLQFRDAIRVMECTECDGTGGFMDTTILRTGEWAWCNKCEGYGHTFSVPALMRLAGVPKKRAPR